jgi:anaerobic selenocysteine-containing dehydrogenase
MSRAIPLYAGVERLQSKGDQIQWGGRVLYEDGRFATPDGKAHFVPTPLHRQGRAPGQFFVSTRRGRQFNSMVHRDVDPLTGAARHAVFISEADAAALGVSAGTRLRLTSDHGTFDGAAFIAPIREGNLEVHWPEGNILLGTEVDPESLEPDYNALVTVEPLR